VLLIGGSTLFRTGLRVLIEKADGLTIVAEAHTPAEGLKHIDSALTDIALVYLENGPEPALQLLEQIEETGTTAPLLLLANRCAPDVSRRLVLGGARGLIFTDQSSEQLLTAIRKVHEGELWVDRATTAQIITEAAKKRREQDSDPERAKIASLTAREREVIALVALGSSNKAIAERMQISDNTVRHHMTTIFNKLDVPDRLALVIYAFRHKLVSHQT
jgi:DNA-binding NarL/FixJ family response regulator